MKNGESIPMKILIAGWKLLDALEHPEDLRDLLEAGDTLKAVFPSPPSIEGELSEPA